MAKKEAENAEEIVKEETVEEEVVAVKTGLYKEPIYEVTLPLTSEKQDDVTVGINGDIVKIQRGVPVKVSAAVYEVLKNSENMDALAVRRRMALEERAKNLK